MQEMGAKNVLVSMAGEGAVFVGENGEVYESEAPKGKLVNSTGAGDSWLPVSLRDIWKSGFYVCT